MTTVLESDNIFAPSPARLSDILIGYGRASTDGQNLDRQIDALNAAECRRILADGRVGGRLKVVNEDLLRGARDLLPESDHSSTSIAKLLGVSVGTVNNHIPELAELWSTTHERARAIGPAKT